MFPFEICVIFLISILNYISSENAVVTNPHVATAEGDEFEVKCSIDSKELKGCYMKTPKNQIFMIFGGVKYENNRIVGSVNNLLILGVYIN